MVVALGGNTGSVTNSGSISIVESYQATTAADGFLKRRLRPGLRPGRHPAADRALGGSISNFGAITVDGNNSFGINVLGGLTGVADQQRRDHPAGRRHRQRPAGAAGGVGINIAGRVAGAVTISGAVTATGVGRQGVVTSAPIGGQLTISNVITATGFRSTSAPIAVQTLQQITADQVEEGGSAWWWAAPSAAASTSPRRRRPPAARPPARRPARSRCSDRRRPW